MSDLLVGLSNALQGSAAAALGAAFLWGVTSVLLSPCHLGTIPLVIAYVGSSEAGQQRSRGALLSFSFAGGMLAAVAVLGVLVSAAGWAVAGLSRYTNYAIAAILLAAGLNLVGILPLPASGLRISTSTRKGRWAAAFLGLVFGVGLSPCTFAFLAPVLAVSFGSAAAHPLSGAALLLAFGVGHCGVIGLAGSSAAYVQRYLDWTSRSRGLTVFKAICGLLLFLSAGALVYSA